MPSITWNMSLAYRMVRQRFHALTDRQRILQSEQTGIAKHHDALQARLVQKKYAITIVENAGGNADDLRSQSHTIRAQLQSVQPRHFYLENATTLIADNLRLLDQAHDALHWLQFENNKLEEFDNLEVPSLTL